jgi:hypothetical protein
MTGAGRVIDFFDAVWVARTDKQHAERRAASRG